MLKTAYFSERGKKNPHTKSFRKHRPPYLQKFYTISKYVCNSDL